MTYYIGIDIGGTFTDCAVLDKSGQIVTIAKSPTRRSEPHRSVMESVSAAARRSEMAVAALVRDCRFFIHGCTVATNAMVERKGVRTALFTTHGHEDAIFIGKASQKVAGRSEREMTHQSHLDKADPPIVSRHHVFGINERVDRNGEIIVALNEDDVEQAIAAIKAEGIEAIAISFLWSFVNPVHEKRVRDLIAAQMPGLFICTSHELAPVLGEYERTATTVANAYIGPNVTGYVDQLEQQLVANGYRYPLLLAHCMGGLTTMEEVRARPLLTLDSGPVSGVLGARFFGEAYGESNIICADMGGTTFDVSLIEGGRYVLDEEPVVDRYTYLLPKVAVESVGAGGGSIIWVDDNGMLRVGPHSAGTDPGPACYANGGEAPAITDIDLVLGYINPEAFLGGEMQLDRSAAERAVDGIAERLNLDRTTVAAGAFKIVNAHMADLIRRTSVDRGHDPRDFVLFAYGGAGALHIAYLARELGIRKVYVPSFATVFSAVGMLTGGLLHSVEKSFSASLPLRPGEWPTLVAVFHQLRSQLEELFDREMVDASARRFELSVYVKYRLQPRALPVRIAGALDDPCSEKRLLAEFERLYAELYGANAGYLTAGVEIIKCRLDGVAATVLPTLAPIAAPAEFDAALALKLHRPVYYSELQDYVRTAIYDGDRLQPGMKIVGPAVVERMGDTIVLPTFATAAVDSFGNIVIVLNDR